MPSYPVSYRPAEKLEIKNSVLGKHAKRPAFFHTNTNIMKKYRTQKQFSEIADNCLNGNWSVAAQNCVDYGFYASDLVDAYKEDESSFEDPTSLAILAEMATELRTGS